MGIRAGTSLPVFHLDCAKVGIMTCMDIEYPEPAFVRQNRLLIVHRLAPRSAAIGNYDVIAFRLIERIELADRARPGSTRRRRRAS